MVLAIGARDGLVAEAARRGLRLLDCPRAGPFRAAVQFAAGRRHAHRIPELHVPELHVPELHVPVLHIIDGDDGAVAAAIDDGADDAIGASASDALIAARLAALVRRSRGRDPLCLGDLAIDRIERRVSRAGRTLDLLPREYRLLRHLAERAGHVVPYAHLRAAVWGLDFDPGTNVVAVHVSRLRAKLDRGFAVPMLLTEKGVGYRLAVPDPDPDPGPDPDPEWDIAVQVAGG